MSSALPRTSAAGPSLAGRFAAAIALTIGFYVLALVIGVGLLAAPILAWALNGAGNLWVTITGAGPRRLDPRGRSFRAAAEVRAARAEASPRREQPRAAGARSATRRAAAGEPHARRGLR